MDISEKWAGKEDILFPASPLPATSQDVADAMKPQPNLRSPSMQAMFRQIADIKGLSDQHRFVLRPSP